MTKRLHFHFSLSCIGEGNGNPLQCSCLENPRDGGAWWAAVSGVAQSRTRLKRLSSSSSSRWCCVRGTCAAPCFCSPVFKSSSRVFWSLRLSCPDCPSCACMQLFSVPYHFLVFCCSRRGVPGCKHRSSAARAPGPRRLTSLTSTVRSVGSTGTPRSPQGLPGNRMPRAGWGELVLKMAVSAGRAFLPSSSCLSHLLPPIVQVASATRTSDTNCHSLLGRFVNILWVPFPIGAQSLGTGKRLRR